ncbi:ABC transporter permease [Pseudomonas aeruginosa]|uniref:ABC transporter permease n=1 Tax=Pseudomonas aeruginosa TaxID=287 RepID=UPI000D342862|nr:hypothetical protein DB390_29755 [Pseudomonas aeruginosa]
MSTFSQITTLWYRRQLILTLGVREVTQRFRSSSLGLLWTVIQPLAVVTIFYFVFSVVFQNRWGAADESKGDFIVALFSGFLIYNLFFDTVARAPLMVVGNINYVKKLVFPIHLIPFICSIGSLISFFCSFSILIIIYMLIHQDVPHLAALSVFVSALPIYILSIGVSWIIASTSVFYRDLNHAVPLALQALVFVSPVLYPMSRVPEGVVSEVMHMNPLAMPIEQARAAIMYGTFPDWTSILQSFAVPVIVCIFGILFFQRLRPGFSDVL